MLLISNEMCLLFSINANCKTKHVVNVRFQIKKRLDISGYI